MHVKPEQWSYQQRAIILVIPSLYFHNLSLLFYFSFLLLLLLIFTSPHPAPPRSPLSRQSFMCAGLHCGSLGDCCLGGALLLYCYNIWLCSFLSQRDINRERRRLKRKSCCKKTAVRGSGNIFEGVAKNIFSLICLLPGHISVWKKSKMQIRWHRFSRQIQKHATL